VCVRVSQAAVSSTPRSPGKRGPTGRATKHSQQQSVLRRPRQRDARHPPHGQDQAAAPNVGTADDQNLPSPEAEREVDQRADPEFSGPIRDLPQVNHHYDDADHKGYSNNSPPPPSPTTLDRRPRPSSNGDSIHAAPQDGNQGYHISADVSTDPDCHDGDYDDDYAGEAGGGAAVAEDNGSIQAPNNQQEEEDNETTGSVSEVDGASARNSSSGEGGGGGGRLVREV
jgi:hypothetical protein